MTAPRCRPDLRREVRAFARHERDRGTYLPSCNAWMDGHDPEFSRLLGERGWIGMTWPRRYGGGERTELERYAVIEELLAAGAPIAAHWFADRQIGPQLLRIGTEEQRQRMLAPMAAGNLHVSIGMSEADAGSDLAAVRTTATRSRGGWVVNGTKLWTSNAHRNHLVVVLCRTGERVTDRHAGLSQLIVGLDAAGVDVAPIAGIDGDSHFCEVTFRDVFVDEADVLGEIGAGWQQVTAELARERSGPERFLSVMPLVDETVSLIAQTPTAGDLELLGSAVGELAVLRQLSIDVADALTRGEVPDLDAALVKDLGTRFEQELVDAISRSEVAASSMTGSFSSLLRSALLAAPGFTLRGGATEVLRSIVGRAALQG